MFKKILTAITLGLVLMVSACSPAYAQNTPVDHRFDTVILIRNGDRMCSAFSLGLGFYYTAEHCTAGATNGLYIKETWDGPKVPGRSPKRLDQYVYFVIATSKNLDSSIIFFEDKEMERPPVKFSEFNPKLGDRIYSIGYPGGMNLTITEGLFNDSETFVPEDMKQVEAQGDNFDARNIKWALRSRFSVRVYHGMSGGPIYWLDPSDNTYKVVSMNSAYMGKIDFIAIGPTLDDMKKFIVTTMEQLAKRS